ncbi:hypothetical protein H5410_044829 [Solanum commersonii]|uniref:Uncharacterized protein n=1 Tax=Solanum commersonii TaxID=4109 RepID=A0A9J5X813_SOLCO|nr:hypothetical protein H5410_044829 [Solanum commersonii]
MAINLDTAPVVAIPHIIDLTNELAREDFQSGCVWQEFVDELQLIVHSPDFG